MRRRRRIQQDMTRHNITATTAGLVGWALVLMFSIQVDVRLWTQHSTAQHSTHPYVSPHASSLATGATTTHPACCSAERCRSVRGCWYMLQCGYIHRPAEFDDSRQTSDDSRHSRMRHHMHDSIHMVKVMSKVHQIMGDDRLNIIWIDAFLSCAARHRHVTSQQLNACN